MFQGALLLQLELFFLLLEYLSLHEQDLLLVLDLLLNFYYLLFLRQDAGNLLEFKMDVAD